MDFDLVTTRTGDNGKTSNYSGSVDWKDAPVFEVLGDLDELSSWLGVLKHFGRYQATLEKVQAKLLHLGSQVATDPSSALAATLTLVTDADVDRLEVWEKHLFDDGVVIEPAFVLPGKTPQSAQVDVARTVCRRAERHFVAYVRHHGRADLHAGSRYLNRLSDVLFVLARSFE